MESQNIDSVVSPSFPRKYVVTVNTKCYCWTSAISTEICWYYWSPEKWRQANTEISSVTTVALCPFEGPPGPLAFTVVSSQLPCAPAFQFFQYRLLSFHGCPCDINLFFLSFLLFYQTCLMIKLMLLHSLHKLGKLYSYVSIRAIDQTWYRFYHSEKPEPDIICSFIFQNYPPSQWICMNKPSKQLGSFALLMWRLNT